MWLFVSVSNLHDLIFVNSNSGQLRISRGLKSTHLSFSILRFYAFFYSTKFSIYVSCSNIRQGNSALVSITIVFSVIFGARYIPSHDCTDGALTRLHCPGRFGRVLNQWFLLKRVDLIIFGAVSHEVVQASMSVMDYKVNPSICQFLKHARVENRVSKEKLRIIVFGGSVTIGSDSGSEISVQIENSFTLCH